MFKKSLNIVVILTFLASTLTPVPKAHADTFLGLPVPGAMVSLSPAYEPVMIKGLTVHKDNPFLFDFIVDVGQDRMSGQPLKQEGEKLIKYFLASLAIPEKDLWVNLSPYEKDRMIPEELSKTDMGRDLLSQDYILKQITASLIYPERKLGKTFWDKVYAKAQEMYGTTRVPVNTFNKVWIMADRAEVFEHNQTAFVTDSHLKVMLEEDYLALSRHVIPAPSQIHSVGSQIIKEIILPELEREVNTGKNFANLRQIFNSLILASWYKKNLKNALLNQVYSDHNKIKGIDLKDQTIKEQIYQRYLQAYKKGVFNYIKEDINASQGTNIPRKYFSGGVGIQHTIAADPVRTRDGRRLDLAMGPSAGRLVEIDAGMMGADNIHGAMPDQAMITDDGNIRFSRRHIYPAEEILDIIDEMLRNLNRSLNPNKLGYVVSLWGQGKQQRAAIAIDLQKKGGFYFPTGTLEGNVVIAMDDVADLKKWLDKERNKIRGKIMSWSIPEHLKYFISDGNLVVDFDKKEEVSLKKVDSILEGWINLLSDEPMNTDSPDVNLMVHVEKSSKTKRLIDQMMMFLPYYDKNQKFPIREVHFDTDILFGSYMNVQLELVPGKSRKDSIMAVIVAMKRLRADLKKARLQHIVQKPKEQTIPLPQDYPLGFAQASILFPDGRYHIDLTRDGQGVYYINPVHLRGGISIYDDSSSKAYSFSISLNKNGKPEIHNASDETLIYIEAPGGDKVKVKGSDFPTVIVPEYRGLFKVLFGDREIIIDRRDDGLYLDEPLLLHDSDVIKFYDGEGNVLSPIVEIYGHFLKEDKIIFENGYAPNDQLKLRYLKITDEAMAAAEPGITAKVIAILKTILELEDKSADELNVYLKVLEEEHLPPDVKKATQWHLVDKGNIFYPLLKGLSSPDLQPVLLAVSKRFPGISESENPQSMAPVMSPEDALSSGPEKGNTEALATTPAKKTLGRTIKKGVLLVSGIVVISLAVLDMLGYRERLENGDVDQVEIVQKSTGSREIQNIIDEAAKDPDIKADPRYLYAVRAFQRAFLQKVYDLKTYDIKFGPPMGSVFPMVKDGQYSTVTDINLENIENLWRESTDNPNCRSWVFSEVIRIGTMALNYETHPDFAYKLGELYARKDTLTDDEVKEFLGRSAAVATIGEKERIDYLIDAGVLRLGRSIDEEMRNEENPLIRGFLSNIGKILRSQIKVPVMKDKTKQEAEELFLKITVYTITNSRLDADLRKRFEDRVRRDFGIDAMFRIYEEVFRFDLKSLIPMEFLGDPEYRLQEEDIQKQPENKIASVTNGGIDLNTNGIHWKDLKDGSGVEMTVDPAMIQRVRRDGLESLTPVIFRITPMPLANVWFLAGLSAAHHGTSTHAVWSGKSHHRAFGVMEFL